MDLPRLDGIGGWWLVAALVVGVVSVGRTARLLVHDDFPPIAWLRLRYVAALPAHSRWAKLAECQFCIAPYLAAGMIAWAWFSDLHWTWWLVNGWWAAAYFAAILVSYDEGAA